MTEHPRYRGHRVGDQLHQDHGHRAVVGFRGRIVVRNEVALDRNECVQQRRRRRRRLRRGRRRASAAVGDRRIDLSQQLRSSLARQRPRLVVRLQIADDVAQDEHRPDLHGCQARVRRIASGERGEPVARQAAHVLGAERQRRRKLGQVGRPGHADEVGHQAVGRDNRQVVDEVDALGGGDARQRRVQPVAGDPRDLGGRVYELLPGHAEYAVGARAVRLRRSGRVAPGDDVDAARDALAALLIGLHRELEIPAGADAAGQHARHVLVAAHKHHVVATARICGGHLQAHQPLRAREDLVGVAGQPLGVEQPRSRRVAHREPAERRLRRRERAAAGQRPQRSDAWREKVVAAARGDELRQPDHGGGCARFQEAVAHGAAVRAGKRASAEACLSHQLAAVDPGRLDELELQIDARVHRDEQQTAAMAVAERVARQQGAAVSHATAKDAVALDLAAAAAVARIGAPDVRAERALLAERVVLGVAEVVQPGLVLAGHVAGDGRREHQRRAVGPAADELCCEALLRVHRVRPLLLDEVAEADDVLFELAEHDVGRAFAKRAVDRQQLGLAIRVRQVQVELAGRDGRPGVLQVRRAAAGRRVAQVEVGERLANAVAKAEVLLAVSERLRIFAVV